MYKRQVYAEIWENSWKPRFHELEHVSKMRLLKTHSQTSERLGYEADKERQVRRERRGSIRNGEKTSMETTAMSPGRGGSGAKKCRCPAVDAMYKVTLGVMPVSLVEVCL